MDEVVEVLIGWAGLDEDFEEEETEYGGGE